MDMEALIYLAQNLALPGPNDQPLKDDDLIAAAIHLRASGVFRQLTGIERFQPAPDLTYDRPVDDPQSEFMR
jgi:hypothetical protein